MNRARQHIRSQKSRDVEGWGIWFLDVFHDHVRIGDEQKLQISKQCLHQVEGTLLSREYNYLRVGFFLFHFGRRGTTVSLWHWGTWSDTLEAFSHSWYCYKDRFEEMELLDMREPIFCNLDIEVVVGELIRFKEIADHEDAPSLIRERYLSAEGLDA